MAVFSPTLVAFPISSCAVVSADLNSEIQEPPLLPTTRKSPHIVASSLKDKFKCANSVQSKLPSLEGDTGSV